MILPTTDPDGGQRSSLDVRERKSHSFLDGTVQAMNSFNLTLPDRLKEKRKSMLYLKKIGLNKAWVF